MEAATLLDQRQPSQKLVVREQSQLARIVAKDRRKPPLNLGDRHAFPNRIALDLVLTDGLNGEIVRFGMSEIEAAD